MGATPDRDAHQIRGEWSRRTRNQMSNVASGVEQFVSIQRIPDSELPTDCRGPRVERIADVISHDTYSVAPGLRYTARR